MRATAVLSGDRGICRDDRRLGSLGSSDYPRVTCAKDGHLAHMERLINGLSSLAPRSLSLSTPTSRLPRRRSVTRFPRTLKNQRTKREPPSRERLLRFSLVKSGPPSLVPPTSTKDERKESRVERPGLSISSRSKINLEYRVFIKSGVDRVARNIRR